ncbi:D-Ala-D-Ala carboxypeptidase family metallohydrolase [Lysobacter panacisoli]|uniref:Peptidase M15A C-terminal domain-containing protein n=1 Tax=Lysobacter panacisoli TaxID=1255263 RepID=A0ABP9LC20_9GAMM|nr:D-Ala-D-Ala carboxypeptidase family metallohydrolase [Lysobacter panacisoli]
MAQIDTPNIFGQFLQGQQAGQEQRRKRTLGEFLQPALGGDQSALSQVYGVDPDAGLQVQGMASKQKAADRDSQIANLSQLARIYPSAPEQMKGHLYGQIVDLTEGLGMAAPGSLPRQHDPALDANFNKFLASVSGDQQPEQFTLGPGAKRFDASGRVIAEVPFAPPSMQYVGVPTGDGGEQKMLFDPRAGSFSAPNYGVEGGAVLDPTQDFPRLASNGAQVTSLYRDPERNAKVGGAANSQHMAGTGGDFVVPPEEKAQFIALAKQMGYEAIDEGDHVHVELPRGAQAANRFGPGQGLGRTPAKDRSFSQLSPQEAAAAGLPPGTVAQRNNETGQISVVSKPDARAGTGVTPLSAGEAAKVRRDFKETKDALNTFKAFDAALGEISKADSVLDGASRGRLGNAYNNARAALRIIYNTGVLQPGELPMLNQALADPNGFAALADPRSREQIQGQLDELYRTIARGIENQVASYPQIFNQQRFDDFRRNAEPTKAASPAPAQFTGFRVLD